MLMLLIIFFTLLQPERIHDWNEVRAQSPDTVLLVNEHVIRECHDAWVAQDKFLHFSTSTALSGFSYYYLISHGSTENSTARMYSLSLGAFAGLAKEIYDCRTKGCFSWKDLIWDGVGLTVAFLMFMR